MLAILLAGSYSCLSANRRRGRSKGERILRRDCDCDLARNRLSGHRIDGRTFSSRMIRSLGWVFEKLIGAGLALLDIPLAKSIVLLVDCASYGGTVASGVDISMRMGKERR